MSEKWVTMWAMAHCGGAIFACNTAGRTTNAAILCSLSGEKIRIRLSNRYGSSDISFNGVCAVVKDGATGEKALQKILFYQKEEASVLQGAELESDEIPLKVNIGDVLEIRISFKDGQVPVSGNALIKSDHSGIGNYTQELDFPNDKSEIWLNPSRLFDTGEPAVMLSSIDVFTEAGAFAIAAFGDSNTFSKAWTHPFEMKLKETGINASLLNLGISGNRLLRGTTNPKLLDLFGKSGIERISWDVFKLSSVKYLILALGGNDIYQPGTYACSIDELCTAEELKRGYEKITLQAKEHGMKVICTTISPIGNTETTNEKRMEIWNEINCWIRSCGKFDAVFDFAKLLEDDDMEGYLKESFDSGDHLHFNLQGGIKIVAKIDLSEIT